MTECRYRIGDALIALTLLLVLIGVCITQGVTEHPAWFAPAGLLVVVFIAGAFLNRKERSRELTQQIRAERQRALGVPPEEVT